jgi:uncharacterized protein (TIGR02270 family)
LEALIDLALKPGQRQLQALKLALQAMDVNAGHQLLVQFEGIANALRLRIIGSGYVGDSRYVPWLLEQMRQPAVARVAAEAFVNITGADFNLEQMESLPPDDFEEGPTEDPDDENVELPEDIALPWPNVERIAQWWQVNSARFRIGERRFLGEPIGVPHCSRILREGFQRQRVAAARYLSLLQPATTLFPTSAPAWRQRRWLSEWK